EKLEAVSGWNGAQARYRVCSAAIDDCVPFAALFNIIAGEPSSDQGEGGVGLGHAPQCARCSVRRGATIKSPIRSVAEQLGCCDSVRRLYAWDATPPSPPALLRSPPGTLSLCPRGVSDLFTRPTWPNVLVLLAGVILTPGRRTVSAALRILGRE